MNKRVLPYRLTDTVSNDTEYNDGVTHAMHPVHQHPHATASRLTYLTPRLHPVPPAAPHACAHHSTEKRWCGTAPVAPADVQERDIVVMRFYTRPFWRKALFAVSGVLTGTAVWLASLWSIEFRTWLLYSDATVQDAQFCHIEVS